MNLTAQMQKLLAKLRSESHTLILDNLESVTGQPLAIPNTLPAAEQQQLRDFLTRLVGGETRVILGSRSDESWLQGAFRQNIYQLRGLDGEARTELSNKILERNVGDARKIAKIREDGDFQKLMKVLAGYPLAMEVVLGNLKNLSCQEILVKLAAADINLDTGSEDKTQSILKCVEYSHSNLSPDAQKLLLCLAPFSGFIWRDCIPLYANELQKLEPFQHYDFDKFDGAIQEAINWGLLSDISSNPSPERGEERLLQIQPVFPFFLKAKLAELDAATREALWEGFKNHYIGLASDYNRYMESKEPQERQIGIFFCRLEYENLYNALQICLEKQETVDIFFCLFQYFYINHDILSNLKLSEFVYNAQVAYPPEIRTGEIGWENLMALSRLASCYLDTKNYLQAKESYLQILELSQQLQGVEATQIKSSLARTYHQLGMVAQYLREYDQGRDYYQQALEIYIEFGDRYSCARTYHQLGTVAEELREYDQGRDYYQQALEIYIEFGDRYSCARTYHQLGMVAQELREYQQGRDYYQQALEIYIEFGDRYSCARTYHQLGRVAEELREYQQARDYYQQALEIKIPFGDRYSCAITYHQLGMVAQYLREYNQARDYYQQALEIKIPFGDRYSQALTLHCLGTLAQAEQNYSEARANLQRALEIYVEFEDEYWATVVREILEGLPE
ncbi:tetratricopeptide repeat protein [Nostoc sp. TCL26-01]|uniref:tetratricopeptide repeat protein n=1 Tax=Nostoc sp. TCL26-01 TaxID=2576904 RepID=UPI00277B57FE|nr:tetratricopeptide repeat protein [Nostoc sp. TCL26-01]